MEDLRAPGVKRRAQPVGRHGAGRESCDPVDARAGRPQLLELGDGADAEPLELLRVLALQTDLLQGRRLRHGERDRVLLDHRRA